MDKVKTRNPTVRVVIAGMQLPNYAGDDYVLAFGKMFSDLAARNNAALVPYLLQGVAGDPSLNLPDGIHPNAAGQRILAENVWRVLEPIAREVTEGRAIHLNRPQAIEVICPYPLRKRQPRRGYRALDKEERWTLHDQVTRIQPTRFSRNVPITPSWRRSKSPPKARLI